MISDEMGEREAFEKDYSELTLCGNHYATANEARDYWDAGVKYARAHSRDAVGDVIDNLTAWKLGDAYHEVSKLPVGDKIDRGLQLSRILKEYGFIVTNNKTERE